MNAKEKFNEISKIIEDSINNTDIDERDIVDLVYKKLFLDIKDLNRIFPFLTNNNFRKYIKERKMMNAYHSLIFSDSWDKALNNALVKSGCYDQPDLNRKFKETFGITPKQAFKEKDESKLKPPYDWERLSALESVDTKPDSKEMTKTKFGIDRANLERIIEASEYQAFYEMDDAKSEEAFNLSNELNVPLKIAFDYIDELYLCDTEIISTLDNNEITKLKYLYFTVFEGKRSLPETLAFLIDEINAHDIDYKALNPDICHIFLDGKVMPEATLNELIELYKEYISSDGKDIFLDFEDYLINIDLISSFAQAVDDEPYYSLDYSDKPWEESSDEEKYDRWAAEQTCGGESDDYEEEDYYN